MAPQQKRLRELEAHLASDKRIHTMGRNQATLLLKGHPQEVLEVIPHRFSQITPIATEIRKKFGVYAFEFFNVDLDVASRWMHENNLFPFSKVKVEPEAGGRIVSMDERWRIPYEVPDLRCLRLAATPQGDDATKAYTRPLETIQAGDVTITAVGREKEALRELGQVIEAQDPDVYLTHGGDQWHIPYLLHRIRYHNLQHQIQLGRLPDPEDPSQKERSFHTYGHIVYRSNAWFLRGRLHIDQSKKFLPDLEDRETLHGIIYLARTSNTDPQRLSRNSPGSCIQQSQIDRAREEGVQIPWKRNLVERLKPLDVMVAVDRGGQVFAPSPGVYDGAWSCDFSGYYPSLIVAHNLSSETINCDCCPDSPKTIPGTDWHICTRREGHQSRTLRPFVEHRRYVRAILKRPDATPDQKAWASALKDELKAIGVVCFGYARFKHARFGCAEVHQSIQALGRDGMTRAKRSAEQAGFERLHTLTDGMVIQKPWATEEEVRALCRRIGRTADVPMDIDAAYDWVVLLPSKGVPGTGVPNRYYGKRRDGTLKLRGIELRRHNTSPWLARAQQAALDVLAQAKSAAGFHMKVPAAIQAAQAHLTELDTSPVEDFAIRVTATKELEDYSQETHTKIALRKLRDAGIGIQPGQLVSYVVLRGSEASPAQRAMPTILLQRPGPLGHEASRPDRDHYTRLLARALETLLAPVGYPEEAILARFHAGQQSAQVQARIDAKWRSKIASKPLPRAANP